MKAKVIGRGSYFDLNARTPSGISAPIQNLLERLPAIASIKGNFNSSFNVSLRDVFKEYYVRGRKI
jgi:hypothetical protein